MKIWTYISTFLAGVVAGLLIFLKLKDPETEIVNNDNQHVGKIKQRGENVSQIIDRNREEATLSRLEGRRAERIRKRAERKLKRLTE